MVFQLPAYQGCRQTIWTLSRWPGTGSASEKLCSTPNHERGESQKPYGKVKLKKKKPRKVVKKVFLNMTLETRNKVLRGHFGEKLSTGFWRHRMRERGGT